MKHFTACWPRRRQRVGVGDLQDHALEQLHGFTRTASLPCLCEAIRLLESDHFGELTSALEDLQRLRASLGAATPA